MTTPIEALDYMLARTPKIAECDADYREAAGVVRAALAEREAILDALLSSARALTSAETTIVHLLRNRGK